MRQSSFDDEQAGGSASIRPAKEIRFVGAGSATSSASDSPYYCEVSCLESNEMGTIQTW